MIVPSSSVVKTVVKGIDLIPSVKIGNYSSLGAISYKLLLLGGIDSMMYLLAWPTRQCLLLSLRIALNIHAYIQANSYKIIKRFIPEYLR